MFTSMFPMISKLPEKYDCVLEYFGYVSHNNEYETKKRWMLTFQRRQVKFGMECGSDCVTDLYAELEKQQKINCSLFAAACV